MNSLSAGSSIGGVPIISSTFSSSQNQQSSEKGNSSNLASPILAIIIPILLSNWFINLVAGAVAGCYFYDKKNKKSP